MAGSEIHQGLVVQPPFLWSRLSDEQTKLHFKMAVGEELMHHEGLWCAKCKRVAETKPGLIDMAPTILELLGISAPAHMSGQNLFAGRTEVK